MSGLKSYYKLYAITTALALFNIIWYLLLNRTYLWFGHDQRFAAGFSFVTWILTLPFTFWSLYYWVQNKLNPDRVYEE